MAEAPKKKIAAKQAAAKQAGVQQAGAQQVAAKKAAARQMLARKIAAKKWAAKKAAGKKAVGKKFPGKKFPGKKFAGKKMPGKKAPAKKAGRREMNLDVTCSRQFTSWLREHNLSLAFTTYQSGKVFFIGSTDDGKLSVFNRDYQRVMGMCSPSPGTLWLSTLYQLWRLEDTLEPDQKSGPFDRLYVPQVSYITGDVDAHDIAIDDKGVPIFVNTLFCCLARPSVSKSFTPVWKPPFISRLAAEDRCHLNGLAMDGTEPAYCTAVSTTDVHSGWREHRADGGVVIDVRKNEILCEGLSMPHSPRLHNGELYVLNSGEGYFGKVDRKTGKFERIAFMQGYARGMSFHGDFAIVGLSLCRENRTFSGLKLDQELDDKKVAARAGLQVIDLRTGDCVHFLELRGDVRELYDVVALPDTQAPSAMGFGTDEIRRSISIQAVKGLHPAPKEEEKPAKKEVAKKDEAAKPAKKDEAAKPTKASAKEEADKSAKTTAKEKEADKKPDDSKDAK